MSTTRLAPSPTGALHLGNARTFLINWALARREGWSVLLRIEDLDGPRIKAEAAEQAIDILRWLGLDWDEGPIYQTHDLAPYHQALEQLAASGDAYPCRCTRSQILAASLSAPHQGEHELRYPGTCRPDAETKPPKAAMDDSDTAWRLITPDEVVVFDDRFLGTQSAHPQREVGDFVVATKAGLPSYQLAVVVDDARQAVTHVVRGDDLLSSTARQVLLYRTLELGDPPEYTHLPIVVGEDGRRLAKRHGDTRLTEFRRQGATAERIIGLLAEWCGLGPRQEMTASQFLDRFDLEQLPSGRVTYTDQDRAWLIS